MAPSVTSPASLDIGALHSSLTDPLLESMTFLNEVTTRFPHAISFAPGRPYEGFFDIDQISRYLNIYTNHLEHDRGLSRDQLRTMIFQYGRTKGQIHEFIARTVENDEGISVSPESVVVTVGCQEGMLLVLRALFARPTDVLLVTSPCYIGVTGAARVLDIEVAAVPEGPQGIRVDDVAAAARRIRASGKRVRALYLVPDFANPSGVSLTVEARQQILAVAEAEDFLILEDNPYGFFVREGAPQPTVKSLDRDRRVVYLGSFAKTAFPGARTGYVLADQEVAGADGRTSLLADELAKLKSMTTVNTPALSQAVIGGMLLDNGFRLREANAETIAFYRSNLEVLLRQLELRFPPERRAEQGIGWNHPAGGFFLTVTVPFSVDSDSLECSAREFGVLWTPMSSFYLDGGGTRQLRLSCSYLSVPEIEEGVRRLSAFVDRQLDTAVTR